MPLNAQAAGADRENGSDAVEHRHGRAFHEWRTAVEESELAQTDDQAIGLAMLQPLHRQVRGRIRSWAGGGS